MSKQMEFLGNSQAIFISGKAGVGKTTVANMIVELWKEKYSGAVCIMPFASEVKNTARFMGWNSQKDNAGRLLLQRVGMAGREYDADTWVGKTYRAIEAMPHAGCIIHDDWRFPNELNYVKMLEEKYGLFHPHTIRVEAPSREILRGTDAYNDSSEISLPDGPNTLYETTIFNEGFGLETLKEVVENVVSILLNNERRF